MGMPQRNLPTPAPLLDELLAVARNDDGDIVKGPLVRFAGDQVFVTAEAMKKIPTKPPADPKPRDVYLAEARKELTLNDGSKIPNKNYGQVVLVKYFARATGAPFHSKKDAEGNVVSVDRVKEYEVYPQEYRVEEVEGARA